VVADNDIKNMADIVLLVDSFYARAEKDELLAPVFSAIADPAAHKEKLYRYWAAVLLKDGSHVSEPLPKHEELSLGHRHFLRWLTLFLQTIDCLYAGPTAEMVKITIIRKTEEFQSKLELPGF
jgi:hemoglobin